MPARKIVAINGSYRGEQGMSHFLLGQLFQGARSAGAECEEVVLAKQKINRCLACDECHTAKHPLECAYAGRDAVGAIFEKMRAADLLVFASPVYIFGISGLMKTFLDRINSTSRTHDFRVTQSGLFFHHVDASLCSKPFVALVCCDSLEAAMPHCSLDYFRSYSRFMDAPLVGTLVRDGALMAGYGSGAQDARVQARLEGICAAYRQAGTDLAGYGRIRRSTQRQANRELLPVPLFGLLKRLRPFRRVMVDRAKEVIPA
jgi:NAD(P)H-dependent FMN reductase